MTRVTDLAWNRPPEADRKLANPQKDASADRLEALRLQDQQFTMLLRDTERVIPQIVDIVDGLLRDTDELLRTDPDAYETIYDDDQITATLDSEYLHVAQAEWTFDDCGNPDSAKLVPVLKRYCLNRPGWSEMIQQLCHAEVTGIAIVRKVWQIEPQPGYSEADKLAFPMYVIKDRSGWVVKDKRRYRPGDPEWANMYLTDSGLSPVGIGGVFGNSTGFRKPVDRDDYIVYAWRNTEDRNGWGDGRLGARLYRLAKYRRPLFHLLLQALENSAGGIRYATLDPEFFAGKGSNQTAAMTAVRNALRDAISGDTIVFPPGVKPELWFPPSTVGDALLKAIDGYIDGMVQKQISGITSGEGDEDKQSYAYGKEVAKKAYRRLVARAGRIAEALDIEYVRHWLELNPWAYAYAQCPPETPRPKLRAQVPGGDDMQQKANVLNNAKVPIEQDYYARELGLQIAPPEALAQGRAFIPALVGGGGGAGAGAHGVAGGSSGGTPSLDYYATEKAQGGGALASTAIVGVPGSPGSAVPGMNGAAAPQPQAPLQAGKPPSAPKPVDPQSILEHAIETQDFALADGARQKLFESLGLPATPLDQATWQQMISGQQQAVAAAAPQPPSRAAQEPWYASIVREAADRRLASGTWKEADHPRDEAGRFTGEGGGDAPESLELSKPGETSPKPRGVIGKVADAAKGAVGKVASAAAAVKEKGVGGAAVAGAKAVVAAVDAVATKMAKPLEDAGYSKGVAKAIAVAAAVVAATPISVGVIGAALGALPAAAAAIPGAAEAVAGIEIAKAVKQPVQTARRIAKAANVVKKIKNHMAKRKEQKDALDSLKAEYDANEAKAGRSRDGANDGSGDETPEGVTSKVAEWIAAFMQKHRDRIPDELSEVFPVALAAVIEETEAAPTESTENDYVDAALEIARAMLEGDDDGEG